MTLAGKLVEGQYRIVRTIARGAVATVYLALDLQGHPYALKVFPQGMEARAHREWSIGSRLLHPHINPVYRRIEVFGRPGVLLAYVAGARFSEWRDRHPTSLFRIFDQLLQALAYMHDQGLVHRDIKPENLLVDHRGTAYLVDFDLSGPSEESFPKKLRLGTLAYLSPEQAVGESPTPAADIYAAGVLLFWAIHGELPYTGSPREVLQAHRFAPIPSLAPDPATQLQRAPELQVYLERLLAKDPKDRFQNGREALEALQDLEATLTQGD